MASLTLSRSSSWRRSLELPHGGSAKVKAYEGDWRKALQLCKVGAGTESEGSKTLRCFVGKEFFLPG